MIYYYICDSCGLVKELGFNPDQELVYCDNLEHGGTEVAMRIVVPEDGIVMVETPKPLENDNTGFFMGLLMAIAFLIAVGLFGVILLLIVKLWVHIWSWAV